MWIGCVTLGIAFASTLIPLVALECTSPHYDITTTGISDATPNPAHAYQGVPFLPECELPDNRKYFCVKSGTNVAMFLTGKPKIAPYDDDFYQIEIEVNGDITISRTGTVLAPQSTAPAGNLLSATAYADLWVSVIESDKTIHIGRRGGAELASWKDTNLIDVNYILVQNYDGNEDFAYWQLCEGALKLLSQNPQSSQTVEATQRDVDAGDGNRVDATAVRAVDGDSNDGVFDQNKCMITDNDAVDVADDMEEFAWWRIDLQDMYHIKAVSVVNSVIGDVSPGCPIGWVSFGLICYYEGRVEMTFDDASMDCKDRGANLATITSQEQQDFIEKWLENAPDNGLQYWTGLSDKDGNNVYEWEDDTPGFNWDGSSATQGFYTNFVTGEPNGGNDKCIRLDWSRDLEWADIACTMTYRYICQKSFCGGNWQLFGNHCYYQEGSSTDGNTAATECEALNGHLATINTAAKQSFMEVWLDGSSNAIYYIGLGDAAVPHTYKWHAGDDPGFKVLSGKGTVVITDPSDVYTNWKSTEPSDGGGTEACVAIHTGESHVWQDRACSGSFKYVCQRDATKSGNTNLAGAEVRIGSCDHTVEDSDGANPLVVIKQNDVCNSKVTPREVELDYTGFWIFRECVANYYGQYVYILKETDSPTAWLSLCEVEVWGLELSDDDKPKIGFTQQTVDNILENDLNEQTITVMRTDGSNHHKTCLGFGLELLSDSTDATGPGSIENTDDYDHASTLLDSAALPNYQYVFGPKDESTMTFTITFNDDGCLEEDEKVAFGFKDLSPGLCAGDDDAVTYDTITYVIRNDDVRYYWEDSTLSIEEGHRPVTGDHVILTGVLRREGYLGASSTAEVTTSTTDETATNNEDFKEIVAGTAESEVVFQPNDVSSNVDVMILEDDDCSETPPGSETFKLVVTNPDPPECLFRGDDLRVTILDDDEIFNFQMTAYTVTETARTLEVVVERTGYIDRVSMIDVKTQPDDSMSAMSDDYEAIDTTLTFPVGRTTASVTVTVTDDSLYEEDETFNLVISRNPLSLATCVLGPDSKTVITIEDNDCYWSVMESKASVAEDDDVAMVTVLCERDDNVVLDIPRTAIVQVDSSAITDNPATSGDDFTSSSSIPVVVNAGETSATVEVAIKDDFVEETEEIFDVTLVSTDHGEIRQLHTTQVTIENDDVTVKLTICGVGNTVLESGQDLTLTLERSGDLSRSDTVVIVTNPITARPTKGTQEGDYDDINVLKTFTANQRTLTQDIAIHDDIEAEGDETFNIHIKAYSQQTRVDPNMNMCTITIIDDDCTFNINVPETGHMVTEGDGVTVPITISRGGYLDRAASVFIEASSLTSNDPSDATSGEDYATPSSLVNFASDESSKTVSLTIIDDDEAEITEYLKLTLSTADCSDGDDYVVIGIRDNDEVVISMRDAEMEVNEDVGAACPVLYRTGSSTRSDVVSLSVTPIAVQGVSRAATPNSDFDDSDLTVTFHQNEYRQQACVTVYNNTVEEQGLESFSVLITRSEHRQARQASSTLQATIDDDNRETIVYIRDDDGTVQLNCPTNRVLESVGSVTCSVERTGAITKSDTAYISTRDAEATSVADYEPQSGKSLTFASGVRSVSFTVKIYDDKDQEGAEDFFIYLASDSSGSDLGQRVEIITIIDDDNMIYFVPTPGTSTTENSVTVAESAGTVHLTIERSSHGFALPSGMSSVRVSSREINVGDAEGAEPADGNGIDFTDVTMDLTFQIRQTRLDIQLEIHDDEIGEPQEAFEVVLSNPSPDRNNFIVYPSLVTIYINDDDGGVGPDEEINDEEDEGGSSLSAPAIIGIGGGLGLLVLVGVLGLLGVFGMVRLSKAPAPTPQRAPRSIPRGPPPVYYSSNPSRLGTSQASQGLQAIGYY